MIAHIVLFRPKADLNLDARREFAEIFQRTCREVSSVRRARIGRALASDMGYVGAFDARYTFSAVIEFDDQAGLLEYLVHPAHQTLGKLFWETCEATAILDVEMADAVNDSLAPFLADPLPVSKKKS